MRIAVGHAGLKSCIDEQAALQGLPSRTPESISESLLDSMDCSGKRNNRRKRVGVVIILPIPSTEFTHPWNHPEWGERNKRRNYYIQEKFGKGCLPGQEEDGRIELHELLTSQFLGLGVPLENIRLIRTRDVFGKTVWKDGNEIWYSTRGNFPTRRNLILIHHRRIPTPKP